MLIFFRDIDAGPAGILSRFPLLMLAAFLVYGLKDIIRGQSLGKFLLGIAVRNRADTLEVPSAAKLFLRNVFGFLWPIDFFILVASADKTKIGDKLAGTDVYRISKKPKVFFIVITVILVFALFVGSLVFGISALLSGHPSYEAAISYIEVNPSILNIVGEIESYGFSSGSISYSGGHGLAEHVIRVRGSDGTLYVHVRLERVPGGDWEIIGFQYRR